MQLGEVMPQRICITLWIYIVVRSRYKCNHPVASPNPMMRKAAKPPLPMSAEASRYVEVMSRQHPNFTTLCRSREATDNWRVKLGALTQVKLEQLLGP